jgi:protein-S-isoprenylcysteine O-methyltransferase Ste14
LDIDGKGNGTKKEPKLAFRIILNLSLLALFFLIPFIASGDWGWAQAWIFLGITVIFFVISRGIAIWLNPDIIRERVTASSKSDTKNWDKWLMPAMIVFPALIGLVAGWNHRFGWPPAVPLSLQVVGLFFFIVAQSFATWAMSVNAFFSSQVRIQTDRGHHVISEGPYKLIRHPGYAGGIMAIVTSALILESYWALIPAIASIPLYCLRTSLEDKTMQEELPGYREYAQKVRFRLFPGIW